MRKREKICLLGRGWCKGQVSFQTDFMTFLSLGRKSSPKVA